MWQEQALALVTLCHFICYYLPIYVIRFESVCPYLVSSHLPRIIRLRVRVIASPKDAEGSRGDGRVGSIFYGWMAAVVRLSISSVPKSVSKPKSRVS
jgi:hypothetical protein